jgi:hypothetical protein
MSVSINYIREKVAEVIEPLTLKLDIRWKGVVSFTPRLIYP